MSVGLGSRPRSSVSMACTLSVPCAFRVRALCKVRLQDGGSEEEPPLYPEAPPHTQLVPLLGLTSLLRKIQEPQIYRGGSPALGRGAWSSKEHYVTVCLESSNKRTDRDKKVTSDCKAQAQRGQRPGVGDSDTVLLLVSLPQSLAGWFPELREAELL